jgi:hypothetical protein
MRLLILWAAAKEVYELYQMCLKQNRPDLAMQYLTEVSRLLDRIDYELANP